MDEKKATPSDEITLRDLILKVRSFIGEILRYWKIPALCALLGLGYQLYRYFTFEPIYPATITFSVDEDEGGSASGLTGILGQFGLGGVRPTRYNLDKILALSKSRRVIEQTLFAKITVDGQEDFIANHLIREYGLGLPNKEKNETEVFSFTHDSLPVFTRQENDMLISLYGLVIGPPNDPKKALMTADYNEDTNIMSIDVGTSDETISLELAHRMFKSLSEYYVNKAIEKQLKTLKIVTEKRDSVLGELKAAEFQLANFRDSNRGLLMRTDQLTELRLQREIAALSAMYAEVIKNAEAADFSLKNKTPFIQVIDAPISPIRPAQISLFRKIVLGLVLGGILGSIYVIGRMIFREIMVQS